MSHQSTPPQSHPQNQTPEATTQNANPSPTPSTPDASLLQGILAALAPVVEFHKAVDSASDNDLRLFWDIRLVQGKDTPFTTMSGHASFPGILSGSALGQMPALLSREIVEKIAVPLNARLQDISNERALRPAPKAAIEQPKQEEPPAKPATPAPVGDAPTADQIVPAHERNEIVDVLLPHTLVNEATAIMAEIQKHD